MSEFKQVYRKRIVYVDCYKNGVKTTNVGFVRVGKGEKTGLQLHISDPGGGKEAAGDVLDFFGAGAAHAQDLSAACRTAGGHRLMISHNFSPYFYKNTSAETLIFKWFLCNYTFFLFFLQRHVTFCRYL